jgi:hypothetical protein
VRKNRTLHPKRCGLLRCGYMGIMFNQGWKVKNKQPMGDYKYVVEIEGGGFIILAFFVYVLLFGQCELSSYNFHLTIQRWSSSSKLSPLLCMVVVATPLWPSVGVKPNTWKSWRLGVFRDSRMFRARQQGAKHLALGCSWCHWKGLET